MAANCIPEARLDDIDTTVDHIADFLRIFFFDEVYSDADNDQFDEGLTLQSTPQSQDENKRVSIAISEATTEEGQTNEQEKKPFRKEWKMTIKNLRSLLVLAAFYIIGVAFYSQYEGWDILTCLYYITISSTTIGYGDYTPTSDHARIFTIFYLFAGVIIVVSGLNSLIEGAFGYVRTVLNEEKKRMHKLAMENLHLGGNDKIAEGQSVDHMKDHSHHHRKEIRHLVKRCMGLVTTLVSMILLGAAYFKWAEGWNYTESVYFVYITSMTIGYGDFGVKQAHSRIFLIFYALLSTSVVSMVISSVSSIRVQIAAEKLRQKLLDAKVDTTLIDNLDVDGDDSITKFEYVVVMLVKTGVLDPTKHVTPWVEKFDEMDVSGDGTLSTQDIIDLMKGLPSSSSFDDKRDKADKKKRRQETKMLSKLSGMKSSYDDEL